MKSRRAALLATMLLLTGVPAHAADNDPKPPPAPQETTPTQPAPAAPEPAVEDPSQVKARLILAKAAALQNAGDLTEPGKLDSFHVVFHKATFESTKTSADGKATTQMIQTDDEGLVFDWKQGSVKTQLTVDGSTTTKAWFNPMKIGWFYDGTKVQSLLGAEHKADYDQLQFHRRVIDQLLDVAILDKLLRDKSRWAILDGAKPYATEGDSIGPAVAVKRTPPAETPTAPALTLWIAHPADGEYGDVVAASMPPLEPGDATLLYRFSYHETFPKVRVKTGDAGPADAKLRFPFKVTVHERFPDAPEPKKVLEVFTKSVDVNTVVDSDFARPKPH